MITIKQDAKAGATKKPLTIEELMDGISASLDKTNGVVGGDRQHSVDSHLRTCIHALGYKPRETIKEGKTVTSIPELLNQLKACIEAGGEVTQEQHDHIRVHLAATHSNCAAEVGTKIAPELKEAPAAAAPLKDPPAALKVPAEPKGAGPGKVAALFILLLSFLAGLLTPSAQAGADNCNITNVIWEGANIVGYPTNSVTTNTYVTGYTTNVVGSVTNIVTNTITLGSGTGRAIEVRNYTYTGIRFSGVCQSSNGSSIILTPIRAISANSPSFVVSNSWGTPLLQASDFETLSSTNNAPTLTIPIPRGTNVIVTWITNLDEWYTKASDYTGFYSITNAGTPGDVVSNAQVLIDKKIIPFSFSGGN